MDAKNIVRFASALAFIFISLPASAAGLVRKEAVRPLLVTVKESSVLVDMGVVWFGQVSLVATPKNVGRNIRVVLRESSQATPLPSTGEEPIGVRFHEVAMVLAEGSNQVPLRELDGRLMPSHVGPVMPFRYVEIFGWEGNMSPSDINVQVAIALEYRNRAEVVFGGDDDTSKWLNRIWRLSSHTMAATSFSGIFVDGDRERLPYEADAYINQLGWHWVTGDTAVPRRTFNFLIENPNWPTEWQFHMHLMAWEDYMFSGDRRQLALHYERLKFLTLYRLVSTQGLVTLIQKTPSFDAASRQTYPMADIVDWPPNQRDGHEMVATNTVVNAFAFRAFVLMAKIASELGHEQDKHYFEQKAAELRRALHQFALSPQGVFYDGVRSTHTSAHSVFFPLAFGLTDAERVSSSVAFLRQRIDYYNGGFPGSVYAAQYMLEALFRYEEDELALRLMVNPTKRGWRNMLEKYDATVTHEAWDVEFKNNEDWTHAWGAAPANVIPRHLIGVSPVEPGWARWRLAPSYALPSAVNAKFPVPQGLIEVNLDPASGTARVYVPPATVCDFFDQSGVRVLAAGHHAITWTPKGAGTAIRGSGIAGPLQ